MILVLDNYDSFTYNLVQAFMAAEDRSFFQHGGVDVSGLGRAMLKNVFNFATGRRLEGGSTITQQVAKNVLLTNDSTIGRKVREAILAQRLEAVLTKEQILELYLNEIVTKFAVAVQRSAATYDASTPMTMSDVSGRSVRSTRRYTKRSNSDTSAPTTAYAPFATIM